jgi:uncharacterized repeat protein (TIGR02543 family)
VSGNGSVTTVSPSRLTSGQPVGQAIRCGLKGTACYSEVSPSAKVQMKAQPGAGYHFTGWTGACSGTSPFCTVAAAAASSVGATFAPKRKARAVGAKLARVRITATFVQSVGQGTLVARGSVTAPARLRLRLRRPGGGPLLTRKLGVPGGAFSLRAKLKKGTLARGATLFPGGFVLSLTGKAGRTSVPLQMRTVYVRSPREGVVRKTHVSASSGGPAAATLPAGTKQAWAVFAFASQPTIGPVTVSWYQPNGTPIGSREKNNRPTIETGIGATSGIGAGNWRVVLSAGGRVIKQLYVRVR